MAEAIRQDPGDRAAARIRFTSGACALGFVLVAYGDGGVRAILLGDDAGTLEQELEDLFPSAGRASDAAGLQPLLEAVTRLVEDPARGATLALALGGSPFQQRVWRALMEVPAGSTISYSGLARRIGQPGAARAVAAACAANRHAIAIPCHRVVRRDGALSGYRWGVARKRELLDREAGR